MGYCIEQTDCDFTIRSENKAAALEAIKALAGHTDEMSGFQVGGGMPEERWYAWVNTSAFRDARCLTDAMYAWRWSLRGTCGRGSLHSLETVTGIAFDGEKLGDDITLFQAIAPYVEPGSYIEMRGEDGALWRWIFDGKSVQEKTATINFD